MSLDAKRLAEEGNPAKFYRHVCSLLPSIHPVSGAFKVHRALGGVMGTVSFPRTGFTGVAISRGCEYPNLKLHTSNTCKFVRMYYTSLKGY